MNTKNLSWMVAMMVAGSNVAFAGAAPSRPAGDQPGIGFLSTDARHEDRGEGIGFLSTDARQGEHDGIGFLSTDARLADGEGIGFLSTDARVLFANLGLCDGLAFLAVCE